MAEEKEHVEGEKSAGDSPEDAKPALKPESRKEETTSRWKTPAKDEAHEEQRRAFMECQTKFEKGNFAEARRQGAAILAKNPAEDVRVRTEDLLDRLNVDPVAVWVAVGCFVLIALIALFTLGS